MLCHAKPFRIACLYISLQKHVIFCTLALHFCISSSYVGRVELPDNLQPLFRPVAMVVPDTAMIVEVLLFTCGFTMAPVLATKLTKLYEMATVQLSQEVTYVAPLLCIVHKHTLGLFF